jgi:ribosomal protein L24E
MMLVSPSTRRDAVITALTCSWCGGRRPSGKLFIYEIKGEKINGLFCSAKCANKTIEEEEDGASN